MHNVAEMKCPGCGALFVAVNPPRVQADPKKLQETIARYRAHNDEIEAAHRTAALERRLAGASVR
jgi:hypothetical protein